MGKYLIQLFIAADKDNVGHWSNTAWEYDDVEAATPTLESIAESNHLGIVKARLVKVIKEVDCNNRKQY